MTRGTQTLGLDGEELAARHLTGRGYRILARRYRTRLGEIDLVARLGDLLVFVEVKTRRGDSFGHPAEAVHFTKRTRLVRAAERYLQEIVERGEAEPLCRFDVVSVTGGGGAPTRIEHIEDAFRP